MKSKRVENRWCGLEWCILNTEKQGFQISSRKWNPFVTDEFPCEALILRMRLSVLYTKCIQFCRKPLYFLAHAKWVKWWHHANFRPFRSSFVVLFNLRVLWFGPRNTIIQILTIQIWKLMALTESLQFVLKLMALTESL